VSRNPATGEILAEFSCATSADVATAVSRARAAQPAWAARPARQRLAVIRRFQQLLLERKKEIGGLITREAGKPYAEALSTEVLVVLDAAQFCRKNVADFLRPERVPHANLLMKTKRGHLLREPV